jgi:isopenicillin N synthase-like dioxygenase
MLLPGDMMQRWSNDSWRSTLHRVVKKETSSQVDNRRQSMAFFVNPGKDVMVG